MKSEREKKRISLLDKVGVTLTNHAVNRYSRRSALYRLATGVAGLFSISMTVSSVMDLGGRANAQSNPSPPPPGPCSHNGTGIAHDSKYCGLHGIECADLKSCAGSACTWNGNCPGSSKPAGGTSGPWRACCLCTGGDGDTGEIFMYQDCCGNVGTICRSAYLGCYAKDSYNAGKRCPRQMNWCDPYNAGTYQCTVAVGPQGSCKYSTFTDGGGYE